MPRSIGQEAYVPQTDTQKAERAAERAREKDDEYHRASYRASVNEVTDILITEVAKLTLLGGEGFTNDQYAQILRMLARRTCEATPIIKLWEILTHGESRDAILNETGRPPAIHHMGGKPVLINWLDIMRAAFTLDVHKSYTRRAPEHHLPDFTYPPPSKDEEKSSAMEVAFGPVDEGASEDEEVNEKNLCTLCGGTIKGDDKTADSSVKGRKYHVYCPEQPDLDEDES